MESKTCYDQFTETQPKLFSETLQKQYISEMTLVAVKQLQLLLFYFLFIYVYMFYALLTVSDRFCEGCPIIVREH